MIRSLLPLIAVLAACQPVVSPVRPLDLRGELIPKAGDAAPSKPDNACWASDTTPAVIESVTEQILVEPEQRDESGAVIRAAVFRSSTQQKIVQDRRAVWFRTPCAGDLTSDVVASLQRALKARGLYMQSLTGQLDTPTQEAIRRYQEPRGLDSGHLSLAAARDLGVIAADRDAL